MTKKQADFPNPDTFHSSAKIGLESTDPPDLTDPRTGEERKPRFVTQVRAEQYWVEKARENPIFFQHYMLEQKPAKHMRLWLANIFSPKHNRINLIAPRESAKTTTALCALAWYIGKNPLSTNGLISVSSDQATNRLRVIKGYIQDNPKYKNIFPDIHLDTKVPNTQQEFSVYSTKNGISYGVWKSLRDRYSDPKDATLWVAGVGGKGIIGRRFSGMLLLDDLIDDKFLTAQAQENIWLYYSQVLLPCVKESGKIVHIGTRWMIDDFPQKLKENPAWKTLEIQGMRTDPITGENVSYWPEEWTVERFERKREEMVSEAGFQIQYMSNPRALATSNFTRESLSQDLPMPLPKFQTIFIGTDWAVSLKTQADFTVFAAVAFDTERNIYLLDMVRFKATKNVLIDELGKFCDRITNTYGKLNGVLMENVAFQATLLQDIPVVRPDLPLIGHTPKGDKAHRVSTLSGMALRGKFFVNQNIGILPIFVAEAMDFPIETQHDDTLDAVTIVLQYAGYGVHSEGLRTIKSPFLL